MLIFVIIVSSIVAFLVALTKKDDKGYGDTKVVTGIKTWLIVFIVLYASLQLFGNSLISSMNTQEIDTSAPDF